MPAVTVDRMREIEDEAMASGVSEGDLMSRAGFALGKAIGEQYPEIGTAVAYIGKGHNGGDALIALRVLRDKFGWEVGVRAGYAEVEWAELTRLQWTGLDLDQSLKAGWEKEAFGPVLLLDGLLGIGAKGALREPLLGMAKEMKSLRDNRGATVVAVDLPSGVNPDNGEVFEGAVIADRTFTLGAAKQGLLMANAANAVGGLALVEVEGLGVSEGGGFELICPQEMNFGKPVRPFDFHKGMAGRVGIVAGSKAFTGAALLAVTGAIRAGGGLVTLYGRSEVCDRVLSRLPVEAMISPCDDLNELVDCRVDAWVVGPGLGEVGEEYLAGLKELLNGTSVPAVIDADGLNLLAGSGFIFGQRHLITPHPGEFARLAPNLVDEGREVAAREFVADCEATLLIKGSRTIVAKNGSPLRMNSTGTPWMANGGQGDVLSGVLGALLAGGMDPFDSASLGAWLCGHAAELTMEQMGDGCTATEIAKRLPLAARSWRRALR
ncbi:MAG: NAD(P)H-hydrate dehydratase [Akkermansiaceae bacterium]